MEVKVHQFVVSGDLKLADELHQVIFQLTLEKNADHQISIG